LRKTERPSEAATLSSSGAPEDDPGRTAPTSPVVSVSAATVEARAPVGIRPNAVTLSVAEGALDAQAQMAMGLAGTDPESIRSTLPSLPPSLKERFTFVRFLGQGGMGAVYLAKDRRLERDVALKFLFGGGAETSLKLLREARSQARLEHENACKIYEVGVADGHRYIVMQFVDGEPLDEAKQAMTLEEKVRVIRQVASALHEAHRLGIVHRDIKPSNIMVEQGEDGVYKPYLMDFGLARMAGERGATLTGAIAGTPAFMAPEQALGEIRSLDRRTDVYSLGATLYDLICGRPPFLDESIVLLLQRVAREDPVPLRKVMPGVPEDLHAIVMKCLEKEPGRRYDSARALGEDLQRFLDGETVMARRVSLGYLLLRKIRRHKGKVALAGAALAVALAVIVAWVRERQLASERARISRELGEDVKEMELSLRNGYSLPLHDIEREKDLVRARLRDVQARITAVGPAGEGPGHYALGRGYLALREPEKAIESLKKASGAGYAPPEVDYAMGLSLVELYKKALEATKRIQSREQKEARTKAIEAEYKAPALAHLRAALGARLDAPAYVEGLIALYEGRHEEAIAKAREAFERTPWLYEAKKLEGDAHFADGSRFRHDAAFDYDRMMLHFNRADAAYRSATEIARSDPDAHAAECELWVQVMNAAQGDPGRLRSSFNRAKQACERAVAASSRSGEARIKMALAYQVFGWYVRYQPAEGESPEVILEEAIARAEEAMRVSPEEPMARYLSGAVLRTKFLFQMDHGIDARALIDRAVKSYEDALRIEPTFLWALNELCSSYMTRARGEVWRGVDPSASVRDAVLRCNRAIELDPSFTYPYINIAIAHFHMAEHLVEKGQSPDPALHAALSSVAAARARSPDMIDVLIIPAWLHTFKARFEIDSGQDPSASIEQAELALKSIARLSPGGTISDELRGLLAFTKAQHMLNQERDPAQALVEARGCFQRIVAETPWDLAFRVSSARTEIIGARWAREAGTLKAAHLDAAMAPLLPLLNKEYAQPHPYQTAAEIHELRAQWLLKAQRPSEEDVAKGLEMAERALAINPRMATALAVKGGLSLLQARSARDPKARSEAAARAKEALSAALRENPLLARDRRAQLEEAERLAAATP
jgi:serine/threonine-protein kinase